MRTRTSDSNGKGSSNLVAPKLARRPRKKRAERSEEIRQAIFLAAARVVGRHGYADASISKITAAAKVAHGTFYNYFASRQDLFEQLLPALGQLLLTHVTEEVAPVSDGFAREEKRLEAWFNFLQIHPEFYRILNEGEVFVPTAFRRHVEGFGSGYLRSLQRAKQRGDLEDFSDEELEPIAYILLAARAYLSFRYVSGNGRAPVPKYVATAYAKLLRHGLFAG
ncbi:TetR/AcrR family transcriptional regulator [Bradyrhizobium brasilense]|uniref:TetR/AcrR family transcriptional regulator n=1 Tax=Bradyrhizobium brasilense TaxID=1419277 RepID=UPI001456E5CB|nr:TetR/AcrR family transcriptional regulator [Bradyrhizobium brasilense]NLS68168.1 TetR/AcrR family transcriptional regulator [Bradyrhizobium brasilense]